MVLALRRSGANGFFMSKLVVRKMELGPIGTNAYLLWEDGGKEAVLIDAPPDCATEIEPVLEEHGLTLSDMAHSWSLGSHGGGK